MGGMWGGTEVSWGACGEALRCVGGITQPSLDHSSRVHSREPNSRIF